MGEGRQLGVVTATEHRRKAWGNRCSCVQHPISTMTRWLQWQATVLGLGAHHTWSCCSRCILFLLQAPVSARLHGCGGVVPPRALVAAKQLQPKQQRVTSWHLSPGTYNSTLLYIHSTSHPQHQDLAKPKRHGRAGRTCLVASTYEVHCPVRLRRHDAPPSKPALSRSAPAAPHVAAAASASSWNFP